MTAVFVHGVPDTPRVWRALLDRIERPDAVALSLPGFGTSVPPGFAATKEAYVDWLAGELERLAPPLDVVGHDWGSLLLVRVVCLRPGLVRSWVGGGAPVTSDYTWHQTARLWQTAGAGERIMARLDAPLAARMLSEAGVPEQDAAEAARHIDPVMKDCILKLYRSAVDVFREWEPGLAAITAPGLVLWGETDVYAAPRFADRLGAATGARVVRLPGCGHWWPCEEPERSADEIRRFWDALSAR